MITMQDCRRRRGSSTTTHLVGWKTTDNMDCLISGAKLIHISLSIFRQCKFVTVGTNAEIGQILREKTDSQQSTHFENTDLDEPLQI